MLLNHAWMPGDSAIVAGMINDWVNALCDLPFETVDRACTKWLANPENIDERGRQLRPAVGAIRVMALHEREMMDFRSQRFLPKQEPAPPQSWDGLKLRLVQDRFNPVQGCDVVALRNELGSAAMAQIQAVRDQYPEITPATAYRQITTVEASEIA